MSWIEFNLKDYKMPLLLGWAPALFICRQYITLILWTKTHRDTEPQRIDFFNFMKWLSNHSKCCQSDSFVKLLSCNKAVSTLNTVSQNRNIQYMCLPHQVIIQRTVFFIRQPNMKIYRQHVFASNFSHLTWYVQDKFRTVTTNISFFPHCSWWS